MISSKKSEPFKNIRIHDIWALEEIENLSLNRDQFNQRPYIEIHVKTKKIYGNDGCQEFSGEIIELDNSNLKFDQLNFKEIDCLKMSLTNQFRELIKEVKHYQLKELKLLFFNKKNQLIMVLKKVD